MCQKGRPSATRIMLFGPAVRPAGRPARPGLLVRDLTRPEDRVLADDRQIDDREQQVGRKPSREIDETCSADSKHPEHHRSRVEAAGHVSRETWLDAPPAGAPPHARVIWLFATATSGRRAEQRRESKAIFIHRRPRAGRPSASMARHCRRQRNLRSSETSALPRYPGTRHARRRTGLRCDLFRLLPGRHRLIRLELLKVIP